MKAASVLFAFIIFLIFLPATRQALAVTVSISSYPTTISDEQFTLTASISGATAGTNYLRIDIYKEGTTNYFGETFNNLDWYGGSTYSQYLPITIQTGAAWNGSVYGRIGSPTLTQYDGEGYYKIRLRRYTSGGGSTASEANASAITVFVSLPTPTPTPTESPTPTPEPTLTPTPTLISTPTKTSTPTKKPTPTKSLTPTKISTPTKTLTSTKIPTLKTSQGSGNATNQKPSKGILGFFSSGQESVKEENPKEIKIASANSNNLVGEIFIILGIVFLILCGIVISWPYLKPILDKSE